MFLHSSFSLPLSRLYYTKSGMNLKFLTFAKPLSVALSSGSTGNASKEKFMKGDSMVQPSFFQACCSFSIFLQTTGISPDMSPAIGSSTNARAHPPPTSTKTLTPVSDNQIGFLHPQGSIDKKPCNLFQSCSLHDFPSTSCL